MLSGGFACLVCITISCFGTSWSRQPAPPRSHPSWPCRLIKVQNVRIHYPLINFDGLQFGTYGNMTLGSKLRSGQRVGRTYTRACSIQLSFFFVWLRFVPLGWESCYGCWWCFWVVLGAGVWEEDKTQRKVACPTAVFCFGFCFAGDASPAN